MTDEDVSHCPWCSAPTPGDPLTCPSCGAVLREDAQAEIPGVTQLDPAAGVTQDGARGRGVLGWLAGDYDAANGETPRSSVEPPSKAVRQEMARLEMEAIRAEIEAEEARLAAEAADAAGALDDGTIPPRPPADAA